MMAKMPCDLKLSRTLLMGYSFKCFEQALVICAATSIDRDLFYMRHSFFNFLRDRAIREKFYDVEKDLKEIQDLSLFELTAWRKKVN